MGPSIHSFVHLFFHSCRHPLNPSFFGPVSPEHQCAPAWAEILDCRAEASLSPHSGLPLSHVTSGRRTRKSQSNRKLYNRILSLSFQMDLLKDRSSPHPTLCQIPETPGMGPGRRLCGWGRALDQGPGDEKTSPSLRVPLLASHCGAGEVATLPCWPPGRTSVCALG